jgi:hypothetical protein
MVTEKASQRNIPAALAVGCAVILFAFLLIWLNPSDPVKPPPTDQEKCTGLSQIDCFEKLSLERRRKEFIESPEGQDFIRAMEATEQR